MSSAEHLHPHQIFRYPLSTKKIDRLQEGDSIEDFPIPKLIDQASSFRQRGLKIQNQVNELYTATLLIRDTFKDQSGRVLEIDCQVIMPELPNTQFWAGADKRITLESSQLQGNLIEKTRGLIDKLLTGRKQR